MATHPNGTQGQHADASATREEAIRLLRRLEADRADSEARLIELGRGDPIKDVTGKSSLDRAIEEAQAIVAQLEQMAKASGGGSPAASANGADHRMNGVGDAAKPASAGRPRPEWATAGASSRGGGGVDHR